MPCAPSVSAGQHATARHHRVPRRPSRPRAAWAIQRDGLPTSHSPQCRPTTLLGGQQTHPINQLHIGRACVSTLSQVRRHRLGRRASAAACLITAVSLIASCGGSSTSTKSTVSSGASSSSGAAEQAVQTAYKGTYTSPPTTAPRPPSGKSVWVVSCGQAAVGCSTPANAAADAAKAIGWNATVYDGKLGVDNAYAAGVRQAVAAKADAIIIGAIDCPLIKQPLQEAKAAHIAVVALLAYDCNDPRFGGGAPLFSGIVIPNTAQPTTAEYSIAQGKMKADWVLSQTAGKATALSLNHTDSLLGQDIAKGFDTEIKACAACKLTSLPFTFAELGTGAVPTKVSQALLKDPSINAVTTPYDSLMALGVAQAIVRSGRKDKISSVGGEGYAQNLELIKSDGGENAAVYESTAWFGWAAVDSVVRLFASAPLQPAGIGSQLVDKTHLPPTDANGIIPPVDFKSVYLKAWGK